MLDPSSGGTPREALLTLPPLVRPIEWRVSDALIPYEDAVAAMDERAAAIAAGEAYELVWLLEHPPIYTAGTSAREEDLLTPRFPVHQTRRGGQLTYHGPGQRIAYVMLDLNARGRDVRRFVASLEAWIIATLAAFDVRGERREDRVGVWVARSEKAQILVNDAMSPAEDKVAAIGIRLRKWVTLHGISLNVEPNLDHFDGIVACGVNGYGVTSLRDLGLAATMPDVDAALRETFRNVFGS